MCCTSGRNPAPQILTKSGIRNLFISRFGEGFYDWSSPDGSSVITFSPGNYGWATLEWKFFDEDVLSAFRKMRVRRAVRCSAIEEEQDDLPASGNALSVPIGHRSIDTYKLYFQKRNLSGYEAFDCIVNRVNVTVIFLCRNIFKN